MANARSNLLDLKIKAHAPSIAPRPKRNKLLAEHTTLNDDICVCANGSGVVLGRLLGKLDEMKAFVAREGTPRANSFHASRHAKCAEVARMLEGPLARAKELLATIVDDSVREGAEQLKKANPNG